MTQEEVQQSHNILILVLWSLWRLLLLTLGEYSPISFRPHFLTLHALVIPNSLAPRGSIWHRPNLNCLSSMLHPSHKKQQASGTSISSSHLSNLHTKLEAAVEDAIHTSHGFLVFPPQGRRVLSGQITEPGSCHHSQQEQCSVCSCSLSTLLHTCYFQG